MTNKDKFLRDGVDKKEFATAIVKRQVWWSSDAKEHFDGIVNDIIMFLDEETKPTLTENERVILKNLYYEKGAYEYERIGRTEKDSEGYSDLYLIEKDLTVTNFNEYIHLFRFIKERRKIFNRGIIGRYLKRKIFYKRSKQATIRK